LATANLVTSAYIADGTIVNADLAPGVALANLTGGTGTLNLSGYSITYPENPVFNGVVSVANNIVFEGSVYAPAYENHVMSYLSGVFTLNASTTFEIQEYPKSSNGNPIVGGYPADVPGVSECYLTAIIIIRIQ
jgi:hypothetical protein